MIEEKKKRRAQLLNEVIDVEDMLQIYGKMMQNSMDPVTSPIRLAMQSRLEATITEAASKRLEIDKIEKELLLGSRNNFEGEGQRQQQSDDERGVKKVKTSNQMSIYHAFSNAGASLSVDGKLMNIREKALFVHDKAVEKLYPCHGCTKECGNPGEHGFE